MTALAGVPGRGFSRLQLSLQPRINNRMLRPPAGPAVAAQIPLETRMTGSQRPDETSPGTTLLAATGICKHFGDFTANDDVGLEIEAGEIHALLGENGAGKSTFVKMVYGLLQPDSGQIIWRGEPVTIRSPQHARELGIGMVFQHFSLFESLSVSENIQLALPAGETLPELSDRIRAMSDAYGLAVDPDAYIHNLSVGQQQRVEVMRCLLQNPSLLIMDEPTSVPVSYTHLTLPTILLV